MQRPTVASGLVAGVVCMAAASAAATWQRVAARRLPAAVATAHPACALGWVAEPRPHVACAPGDAPMPPAWEWVLHRRLDVNAASVADLMQVDGVGPKLAAAIVRWRAQHGYVARLDALRDVPGVGPRLLVRLLAVLRVEAPTKDGSVRPS